MFHVQDQFGEVREKLYLVRETKGSADPANPRGAERMKIECAERHFGVIAAESSAVDYDVVSTVETFREKVLVD